MMKLTTINGQPISIGDKLVGQEEKNKLKEFLTTTKRMYQFYYKYNGESVEDIIDYNDTEYVEEIDYLYGYCTKLKSYPAINTKNAKKISHYAYQASQNIKEVFLETDNAEDLSGLFNQTYFEKVKLSNTSKVKKMDYMFCVTRITESPEMDTSNVEIMNNMFNNTYSIKIVKSMDTRKVKNITYCFAGCSNIHTIEGVIDLISIESVNNQINLFYNCKLLENVKLANIKWNLQLGSSNSWGHLLSLDSLITACKECIMADETRTLTLGSVNISKIENIYVKFTDSSITTISVGEKGEVEVCESTDEGAMTLIDYMNMKGWTVA